MSQLNLKKIDMEELLKALLDVYIPVLNTNCKKTFAFLDEYVPPPTRKERRKRERELKKKEKLTAYWDKKENCIGAYHPLGFMTQTDAHYLFDKVFTKDFVKEMTDRGYDVRTMKFEISLKLPNYERFNGLSKKYYGKEK